MPASVLRFGRFELDPASFQLRRSGRPLRLERIPLEVLLFLVERRGQLVLRHEIADLIWGTDVVLDIDNALNTAIRKIRRALRDDPAHARYVETVPAKGYRFIGVVTSATPRELGTSAEVGHRQSGSRSAERAIALPDVQIPEHLVEKTPVVTLALEGERKHVTVLFAHLEGVAGLLADRNPEEARTLLDPLLAAMMEAVRLYEGTVSQVMGDGIMALFGAPFTHEDHAVRACYAALRMRELLAEGGRRPEDVRIHVRVGLDSGEVVVRDIGSDRHRHYTAVGQTVHVAARMAQFAAPGSVVATAATLRLAAGYVHVTPLAVNDVGSPLDVYEVKERGEVRSRLQAAATRGLSPFVGRDAEFAQLHRALAQARQGQGQVAAIVGEPGVGKSRLVLELMRSARAEGWLVLEARPVSYGKASSYLPVIGLLKDYFRIAARDTPGDILNKVTAKILGLDSALEPTRPALLALLDVPFDDSQWQGLDPSQRRQRTLDVVTRLVGREAQRQPVLVVFEDLHWIDTETQALLDRLVERLPTAPLLLLVDYRPEYRHTWGSRMYYAQLRLDPLSPESAEALLDALLGHDASLESFKTLLAGRTERNPLFLEEGVRALVELQVLLGEPGAYRLAHSVDTIQVPATVQTTLAWRIDRLPPAEKRLLETAAVIGKDVPSVLLHAVTEVAEETVQRGLAHLQAAEFLYETRLFPDPEYTFKHALTHEVAYGSVLHKRRRALHARIVEAVETLHPDRLGEHAERLALHALRGEVWPKAVTYLRQAAAKALSRSASREAVSCLQQALGVLAHLPESRETSEQAIDLRLDLQVPLNNLGEIEQLLDYLREAEPLAEALGDLHRMGRVAVYMAFGLLSSMGDLEQVAASGERALAIARTIGDVGLEAQANYRIGQAYAGRGEYSRAIAALKRNVDILVGDLQTERFGMAGLPAVLSRATMSEYLAQLGEFPAAMAAAEEAVRMAEAADDRAGLVNSQCRVGVIQLLRGNPERALPWLERSLDSSRRFNVEYWSVTASYRLGEARAACGDTVEALPMLEQAAERAASMRFVAGLHKVLGTLAEGYLLAGRLAEARQTAERMLGLTRAMGLRYSEAEALRILGEVHARTNPAEACQAEASYRQALAIAEQMGTRPLAAHCHLGLGKVYRRADKREQAREHLIAATTMYSEMDMQFWLEQAEAAIRKPATHGPRA